MEFSCQLINQKYEIYPDIDMQQTMNTWISRCWMTYNSAILDRSTAYKVEKKSLSYKMQSAQLTADKKKFSFLKDVPSQPLQETLKRVDRSFQNFFRKDANYPKIKPRKRYNSLTFTQFGIGKQRDKKGVLRTLRYAASLGPKNTLRISKLGDIPMDFHRKLEGKVRQVIIKQQGNRWYAIFSVERQVANENLDKSNAVGIDVGIKTFAFLSNGEKVHNPKFLRRKERKLKRVQRKLSKMTNGSSNYKKQVQKLRHVHEKIANQRKDFLHKVSYQISKTYSVVCVEDLNIRNMVRNRKLSKSIHDAGWGMFRNLLDYKCHREGGRLVWVAPHFTTQDCSGCGNRVKKSLSMRTHVCLKCGTVLDRDHNAAFNILHKGLATL